MRAARRGGVALLAALTLSPAVAGAQSDETTLPAYKMLYASTLRCFVADGLVEGDYKDSQELAKAAAYEQKAKQSFDMGFQAGRRIGMSDAQIQADFDAANATELPRQMRDKAYFAAAVSLCKRLGLM